MDFVVFTPLSSLELPIQLYLLLLLFLFCYNPSVNFNTYSLFFLTLTINVKLLFVVLLLLSFGFKARHCDLNPVLYLIMFNLELRLIIEDIRLHQLSSHLKTLTLYSLTLTIQYINAHSLY
jgi:hypothetical protein